MKKLNLLFAESSIELIPDELWRINEVRKFVDKFFGKNRFQILLDINYFYRWMDKLSKKEKRGRPDILHFCLLNSLDSIANQENMLNVYIHTINNELFEVNPEIRIPKNYDRFKGVIADLLNYGRVPKKGEKWLIRKMNIDLEDFFEKFDGIILLSEKGILKKPDDIIEESFENYKNPLFVIGAFPHGDFDEIFYKKANKIYSIYDKPLMAWIVTMEIVTSFERKFIFQ